VIRTATAAGFVVMTAVRPAPAHAQMQVTRIDEPPRTAAYMEIGGNAKFSTNVDLMIASHTSIRMGGFIWAFTDDGDGPWNALVMANQLFGSGGHYVEVGVGVVALHRFDNLQATAAGVTSSVGYRVQSRRQFGRIVLTPSAPRADGRRRRAVLGFSYGVAF